MYKLLIGILPLVYYCRYITIGILLIGILSGCASTSEHWQEKRRIVDPFTGEEQEVLVDVIKQKGIIKAKHPTGADAESKPWIETPQWPGRYEP